jgi:DNA-binding response OmpR family regulator
MRILIIEDSPPTRDLLRRSLEDGGHSVSLASRVSTGLRLATSSPYEVLVIDVMLPDGSGIELCRTLRHQGVHTPILFLTAKGEVDDRIAGLDAGADDYLRKPFALAELHARIRALGRRQGLAAPAHIERGSIRIDFAARRLECAGETVPLTGREWAVLEVLVARAGRVVPRQELLESAWPNPHPAASDSLDVIVSRLRRKLGHSGEGEWIRTVRGEGYVFEISP